jgi:hypothetical protein
MVRGIGFLMLCLFPAIISGQVSDSLDQKYIDTIPQKICWDSFLVPYIYFVPNTNRIADSSAFPAWVLASNEISGYGIDLGYKLKIKSYCGYKESKRLAKKRLDLIFIDLVANDWLIDNLTYEICGKKELFICQYCDGCHYRDLKGKGITINRKFLRSKTKQECLRLENMRSCVTLEWYKETQRIN